MKNPITKPSFSFRQMLIFIVSMMILPAAFAQGVSINNSNTPPDPSAMLDVESTTRGFLPPRLTAAQRTAVQNPASGLVVFDTDFNALFVMTGEGWMQVDAGEKWLKDDDNNLTYNLGKVGIGVDYPDAEFELNGQIKITGGDPGSGKVLTSDENGTATWQNNPMSILSFSQRTGFSTITSNLSFLVFPAIVTITETAGIMINSTRTLGTTTGITTGTFNIYICYRNTDGGNIITMGGGMLGLRLPANSRIPFSLSYSTPLLPAGIYEVGLCGACSDPSQWNSNDWGYTTAMAYKVPASKSQHYQYQHSSFETLFEREPTTENEHQSKSAPNPEAVASSNNVAPTLSVEEMMVQLQSENEIIKAQLNTLMKMIEANHSSTSIKQ